MSIASEITRLQGVKADILQAIANKGVTVPSGSALDDCPGLIADIPTGPDEFVFDFENAAQSSDKVVYNGVSVKGTLATDGVLLRKHITLQSSSGDNYFPISGVTLKNDVYIELILSRSSGSGYCWVSPSVWGDMMLEQSTNVSVLSTSAETANNIIVQKSGGSNNRWALTGFEASQNKVFVFGIKRAGNNMSLYVNNCKVSNCVGHNINLRNMLYLQGSVQMELWGLKITNL